MTTRDAGRKRIEANMIASPTWMLNRRARNWCSARQR